MNNLQPHHGKGIGSQQLVLTLLIPCVYLVYHHVLFPLFRRDLRTIPGPFLAKITDLYRLFIVRTGSAHEYHIRLHERHGPFVRLGPNNVSVGSPAAIPVLYNARTRFPKSDFYPVMGNVARGKVVPTIFSTLDESVHESMKRPIAQVYAMTSLQTYEPLVESTETLFFRKLEKLVEEERSFDLGTWLHWFATDVIMEITFGKRVGFLEREEDVDGILATIEKRFWYVAVTGQLPWLDKLFHKNSLITFLSGLWWKQKISPVLRFTLDQIEERKRARQGNPEKKGQERDFLSRFLDIQDGRPDIPDFWIISWCQQNVQAGSESTAITLTSVIYHLLKTPDSMQMLLAELNNANLPSPIPWDMAHKLPCLDSCIKEALRMTPAIGIPLERVAPPEGIELSGKYFEPGTVLGVNAWVVHRDQQVFGVDAASWRPERWIEAGPDARKAMERALFAFGGGSRVCLGKNISYLEMYKVIPELLTRFKVCYFRFNRFDLSVHTYDPTPIQFELTNPRREWSVKNGFFTYTKGVEVKIQKRTSSD
ncbi:pisatin demethylase [Penicillium argentinense]|uniref:Pisatin demethylase n=1 Tax=Penicillium argentinense TaxID=1131581 RepID=A0A9W9EIL4_9EURO|nr:pisatin demethylase [Penicillium argentinense]KAJ5082506.1 pisatin demethylase [Penicillium argentinense]